MRQLRKSSQNFVVDSLAFVAFLFLTTTGILMYYILPPGSGHYSRIWGLDRHQWGDIHFWIAMLFFLFLALHLFLHWNWIISFFQRRNTEIRMRPLLGMIGVLALIAIAISPILTPVSRDTETSPRRQTPKEILPEKRSQPDSTRKNSIREQPVPKNRNNKKSGTELETDQETQDIRGYMTLEMIETEFGVPVEYMIRQLSLPEDTPSEIKLGEIRRTSGYTMEEIRRVIEEYRE